MTKPLALAAALVWGVAHPAHGADGIASVTIDGTRAEARIELASYAVDLTISFEQAVGVTAENLGLSARLISPLDTAFRARLPGGSLVSLPAALPLVVTIEPPASGGLSFSGVTSIEVHTHDLAFTANSPLRLFSAPLGGSFADITESMGMGSYRARGHTGGFSEFLVVADLRQPTAVVAEKLTALAALFDLHAGAMPAAMAAELDGLLAAIADEWAAGDHIGAIAAVEAFDTAVREASGSAIPDVWRSSRDVANAAGELRGAAATLRFGLALAGSG